jgi:hypothetical protein
MANLDGVKLVGLEPDDVQYLIEVIEKEIAGYEKAKLEFAKMPRSGVKDYLEAQELVKLKIGKQLLEILRK